MTDAAVRALTVRTEAHRHPAPLTAYADPRRPLAFVRRGDGIVGIGQALRLEFSGRDRVADAAAAWRELVARADVRDDVRVPGSGLVAFGVFTFADVSANTSALIVPSMIVGRRGDVSWTTRVDTDAPLPEPAPTGAPPAFDLSPGALTGDDFERAVERAVERIREGRLEKVVLARDLVGRAGGDEDVRRAVESLALAYPDTWTYAVDGSIGSSPELLVSVTGGTVRARVLAGSIERGVDARADEQRVIELTTSSKDLDEHGFAVRSAVSALRPLSPSITASDLPFALKLPNLWHLASDLEGAIDPALHSCLDLVSALHPTAAVAGTPRDAALELIAELEPFDRGRYAGPVGWIGAHGDGEWAIALRGAHIWRDGRVVAYAGAGIVADSRPDRELAETTLKFRPVLEALGS